MPKLALVPEAFSSTDPLAETVATYVVGTLEVHPITVVEHLLRQSNPHFVRVDGYWLLEGNHEINFPDDLIPSTSTRISLCHFIFVLLFREPFTWHYSFLRHQHDILRRADAVRDLTPVELSITWAVEQFDGAAGMPWLLSNCIIAVDRNDLRGVVCHAAKMMQLLGRTICSVNQLLFHSLSYREDPSHRVLCYQPWKLNQATVFYDMFKQCIRDAQIVVAPVDWPVSELVLQYHSPDVVIDNQIALVMTPEDKVLVLSLLLFSAESNVLQKLYSMGCSTLSSWRSFGLPVQLDLMVSQFERARKREVSS